MPVFSRKSGANYFQEINTDKSVEREEKEIVMIIKWIFIILGGLVGLYFSVGGILLIIDQIIQRRRFANLKIRVFINKIEEMAGEQEWND